MTVIGAVGLTGSWAASEAVERTQQRHAGQVMDQYADAVNRAVTSEADRYGDTLSDLAAAVGAQSDLSKADFLQISSKLSRQRLPGAAGVALVIPAGNTDISSTQAFWRAQGASDLTLVPNKTADEHLFIVLNSALDGTDSTAGRDLSRAPEPVDALRMARTSGQITASHTYVLLMDRARPADEQQMSFLLAAPINAGMGTPDAGRFRGWIIMGMRGGDFMTETMQFQSHGAVSATLLDRSTTTPTVVARPPTAIPARASTLNRERTIIVGQRRWDLRLEPTKNLLTTTDQRMPAVTLGIGVLITLLVAAMAGILSGARNRAMDKVDQATAALQDDIQRRTRVE
ncbi:CHASE domain-containing protein, partial [Actinoplanes solisilvae]|uniref:CHASE domain-containing protein n=1 Tax=Actinoplanes solisilvae TaxID=2486853 RepID=UPI00196AA536